MPDRVELPERLLQALRWIGKRRAVERAEDRTPNMAANAAGWRAARANREAELRAIEGDDSFAGQQRFLETAAALARERRLSRIAVLARRQ